MPSFSNIRRAVLRGITRQRKVPNIGPYSNYALFGIPAPPRFWKPTVEDRALFGSTPLVLPVILLTPPHEAAPTATPAVVDSVNATLAVPDKPSKYHSEHRPLRRSSHAYQISACPRQIPRQISEQDRKDIGFGVVVPYSSTCKEFVFDSSMQREEMFDGLAQYLHTETGRQATTPLFLVSYVYSNVIQDAKSYGSWLEWAKGRPLEDRILMAA